MGIEVGYISMCCIAQVELGVGSKVGNGCLMDWLFHRCTKCGKQCESIKGTKVRARITKAVRYIGQVVP